MHQGLFVYSRYKTSIGTSIPDVFKS